MATIMLDAGHGGYDSGAVYGDRYEKNDTLSLVLAVGTILENNGVDVLYTRTTDVYQSPNEKAWIANRRPNRAVLRGTRMPAALVEVGFINTDQDNQIFDLKFPEMAQAIANGIMQTVQGADVTANEAVVYRIEMGMFRHKKNAEALAANLQEDGISCYSEPQGSYFVVCHGAFADKESAGEMEEKLFLAGYETRITCVGEQ